jgi:hypothetical protein
MNTPPIHYTDERIKETARSFRYPPTPDVTGVVLKRLEGGGRPRAQWRNAWAIVTLVFLLLAILFAVPGVRAEIVRFFQVGVVRIFPPAPPPTALPSLPQSPMTATPLATFPVTATSQAGDTPDGPSHQVTFADIAGETTLESAQARVSFPIRLPTYPEDLGTPERVFVQENNLMVILVWSDPADPTGARLSLHEIGQGSLLVGKFEPRVIQETQVNGHYAVWAEGPYLVQLTNGDIDFRRTVAGNTLIWEEQGITYRLESNVALEEALKIAESLE